MKICKKELHQYEGKRCIECMRIGQRERRSTSEYRAKTRDISRARYANNPQIRAKQAEYQRKPEVRVKRVEYQRAYMYGLHHGERDVIFSKQGHVCANRGCKSAEPGNKNGWHIDHCHLTGKVRGVLCHHCNVALGQTKDSEQRLLGLVEYLRAHKELVA